jgi:transcriptional regulator with XRE-family HTH domain
MAKTAKIEEGDPIVPRAVVSTIDDDVKRDFGKLLYRLMVAKGWNQSQLAAETFGQTEDGRGYKVARGRDLISKYLRGVTFPDNKTLAKLAKALDIEPSDLLPPSLKVKFSANEEEYHVKPFDDGTSFLILKAHLPDEIVAKIIALRQEGCTMLKAMKSETRKRGK